MASFRVTMAHLVYLATLENLVGLVAKVIRNMRPRTKKNILRLIN